MKWDILFIVQCDSKSQCSHMWVHWLKNCAITFNLHDKLFYSVATIVVFNNDFYCHMKRISPFICISYRLFVFFNNANTVSAEMWVWGFGNHAWYKSLVKSLVFDSWLETFVSLVISKTPYSHFLLTLFSHWCGVFFRLINCDCFQRLSRTIPRKDKKNSNRYLKTDNSGSTSIYWKCHYAI